MSKTGKPTARQDRDTNKRQRGENHARDQRLDGHDTTLSNHQGQIDSEKSTRQSADSNLHGRVDNEATARSNKDSNLDNQTQALRDRASALESFQGRPAGFAGNPHGDNQHTENYAKSGDVYAKGATDDRFLKARAHPDFEGHGNTAHNPQMAVKNHTHSVGFKDFPLDAMQQILAMRNLIRSNRDNNNTGAAAVQNLQHAVLHILHMLIDSPEMTGDAGLAAMQDNEDYREVWSLLQVSPTPSDAHFLNNRGPDIANGSGVYGTEGTTNQIWYPPKETELLSAQLMTRNGRTSSISIADVPDGSPMLMIVTARTNTDANFTVPSGWTKLAFNENSSHTRTFKVYYRQKSAGQNNASVTVAATLPFEAALVVLDNYTGFKGSINNFNPFIDPPDNIPRAFGAKAFPRGKTLVAFNVPQGSYPDIKPDPGMEELIRFEGESGWANFYLYVRDAGSSDYVTPVYLRDGHVGGAWGSLVLNTKPRKKTLDEARAEANL